MNGTLGAGLARLGLDPALGLPLERYVRLLLARNVALNLTGAKDEASAVDHVLDSLGLLPYVREPLVDIGSGGGFPAIPLAIVTAMRMTLVESVVKKARFLEEVVRALELPVTVLPIRAEDAARRPELREAFASATARAVSSATTVIELTVPFLELGGLAVLQRGSFSDAESAAAADAALVLGARVEGAVAATEPGEDRTVLLVRKFTHTGERFPRRAGMPAKRPLCWQRSDG